MKANTDVDLFASVDMKNFMWFTPGSLPENIDRALVFYSNPTKEMRENSGIEPTGAKTFDVNPDETTLVDPIAVEEVHTKMDSNPTVRDMILEEIARLGADGISPEELERIYREYTSNPNTED